MPTTYFRRREETKDGTVSILRWAGLEKVHTFHHSGSVREIAFSQDGRSIAVVDAAGVTVHDIESRASVLRIPTPSASDVGFSSDD
jgi:hypothetical protein